MQTQNLATAVASRRNGPSASSKARASRSAVAVAASDSMQRSARTFCISGCSARGRPNAERWAAWWVASATARRIRAAEPSTQSSRVWTTISRIVRSPRPSSPTSRATAPSSAISADAFERLPSLSFSRSILKPACGRSSRKQESPAGACASTRNASLIGAEQNHLCPSSSQTSPSCRATVSFARTSEPPCRSVIAIPQSASPLVSRGTHSAARSGCPRSAGTAANVIESGQPTPASTWPSRMNSAARATCAPECGSIHGSDCTRASRPSRSSESHAGWNSISSIRSP